MSSSDARLRELASSLAKVDYGNDDLLTFVICFLRSQQHEQGEAGSLDRSPHSSFEVSVFDCINETFRVLE